MATPTDNLRLADFGLEIVNTAWMRVHASISRISETDADLYEQVCAVSDAINALSRTLRTRLRNADAPPTPAIAQHTQGQ